MKHSPKIINNELNKDNFNFKKKFGQNFIVDKNIIHSIINKSNIDKALDRVLIGPGAGALTTELDKVSSHVIAYEIDETLKPILEKQNLKNTEIIYQDFLKRNVKEDLKKYNYKKIYVVANLPYYITTPIIMKLIQDNLNIDKIVVMVQKEVGDRFKAKPNTKEYNSLSIYLNYYFTVEKLLDVSKNVFIPKPNVDSVVVCFTKKEHKTKVDNEEIFFKLVKDSFKQKRKTLKNNLKGYDLDKIEEILNKHNLNLTVRAEALPIEIFAEIANNLNVNQNK